MTQSEKPLPDARLGAEEMHAKRTLEVLNAAMTVFSTQGFAAADVQEIADQAGVGKGTVYRRFTNKEGLFLATVEHARQWLLKELDQAVDASTCPLEQIRVGIHTFITFFDSHPEVVELLIQERAHFRGRHKATFFDERPKENQKWIALFARLVEEGVMRERPVELIDEAICNFVFGTMFLNYFAGRKKPLAQQSQELFDVLFNGLLTPASATGEDTVNGSA
ncbi:MAG: TetR/AcrR family transcriptional regulator [Planctomycetia bacterium]|nr:TetR/AcrR family transcriptional regulator [Planctomycetia bacterium]